MPFCWVPSRKKLSVESRTAFSLSIPPAFALKQCSVGQALLVAGCCLLTPPRSPLNTPTRPSHSPLLFPHDEVTSAHAVPLMF